MVGLVLFFALLIVAGFDRPAHQDRRGVLHQGALLSQHPSYL
jgi:hypothetical protein